MAEARYHVTASLSIHGQHACIEIEGRPTAHLYGDDAMRFLETLGTPGTTPEQFDALVAQFYREAREGGSRKDKG